MGMNHRLMRPLAGAPSGTPASLLLHFDGTNGSTDFPDSSPNALTVVANGDVQISTAESKWGGASGLCDGAGDFVSHASGLWADWESGDWTIEMWLYPLSVSGYAPVVFANLSINIHLYGNGDVYVNNSVDGQGGIAAAEVLAAAQWQHLAVVRAAGETTVYIDGTSVASGPVPYGNGATTLHIGGDTTQNSYYYGYIDDLRIVKGLAVYTSNFTPPAGPLSATVTPQ